MRILQVITGLGKAAGTSVFCGEIANELVAMGHDVGIAVCHPHLTNGYPLDPRVRMLDLAHVAGFAEWDVLHVHALWNPVLHRISRLAHRQGVPVVWSPHGMITPWAMRNKRLKKLLAWHLYQKRDLQSAALLHATAQSEIEDIRRLGLKNKVVIAPLGVRLHKPNNRTIEQSKKRTLLFVSRVQRKKGLPNLIEAWSRLPADLRKDWQIRIVGPDQDNHTAELMSQCDRLGLSYSDERSIEQSNNRIIEQLAFVGPKFDTELAREYDNADLFVLPTHSENFGSVVIEALAHGVPVITTKQAPWAELEEFNCGWWIDDDVQVLCSTLKYAIENAVELPVMGNRGRELVCQRYLWSKSAAELLNGYNAIVGRCDMI